MVKEGTREHCIKARVGGGDMDSGWKGTPKKCKKGRKVRTGRVVEGRPMLILHAEGKQQWERRRHGERGATVGAWLWRKQMLSWTLATEKCSSSSTVCTHDVGQGRRLRFQRAPRGCWATCAQTTLWGVRVQDVSSSVTGSVARNEPVGVCAMCILKLSGMKAVGGMKENQQSSTQAVSDN